jgi:Tol biopolymer transport system component
MNLLNLSIIGFLCLYIFSCGTSTRSPDTGTFGTGEEESIERIRDLQENIADQPNNLEWRLQLAREYENLGRNMEALKTYENALIIDPNYSDLKYSYAELALKMGDKRKAFQSYKEILLGVDGQQYLGRIAPKFIDAYDVIPVVQTGSHEAFGFYSNDGSKILYQIYNNTNWDIFEYDVYAQTSRQITSDLAHEENPVYSPDSKFIAYTSTRDDHREVEYNQKLRDIYIKDLNSNLETNLTTNSSNDWRPRYSKDGKYIVFVSERSDLRDVSIVDLYSSVYIMEANGSFQLQLTKIEANNGGPVMAGGETEPVYFDSNRDGTYAIYKMNTNGDELEQITANMDYNNVAPDISSDGSKIVFFSDRDGNYEIYMMNADGTNEQRLTSNPSDDLNPIFSADAQKVLFHSDRGGNFDIYELDLAKKNDTVTLSDLITRIDSALSTL